MKNKLSSYLIAFFFSVATTLSLFSCKNTEDPDDVPTPPPCTDLLIQEDVSYDPGSGTSGVTKVVYIYNSSNKLVKKEQYENTPLTYLDTITYSGSNQIDSILYYSVNSGTKTLVRTQKYSYSGNMIQSIKETGDNLNGSYDKTSTYSYNTSGQLTGITVAYTSGTPDFGNENISNVAYTGSNITSFDQYGETNSLEYDTYANPHRNIDYYADFPWLLFSANNITKISYGTSSDETYTYTYENGKVKTYEDQDATYTYTYTCR